MYFLTIFFFLPKRIVLIGTRIFVALSPVNSITFIITGDITLGVFSEDTLYSRSDYLVYGRGR